METWGRFAFGGGLSKSNDDGWSLGLVLNAKAECPQTTQAV